MGRSQLASVLFLLSKMRHLHKVECRKVGWIPMHRFIRKLFVKSKLWNCYNYGSEAPAEDRVLNTIYFEKKNDQLRKEKFHLWNGKGECPNFFNRTHTGWSIFFWQQYRRTEIFHAKVAFPWPGVLRLKSPPLDFTNVSYLKDKTKIKKTMISKWIHPFFHDSLPKW